MKYVYSKIHQEKLLHIINKLEDICHRTDLSPTEQFLQVATIKVNPEAKYKTHQHIWKTLENNQIIAQECWIVIKGSICVHLFDIDGTLLKTEVINAGDCSITFEGGHKFEVIEKNTILYECKTGPYLGIEKDKIFY